MKNDNMAEWVLSLLIGGKQAEARMADLTEQHVLDVEKFGLSRAKVSFYRNIVSAVVCQAVAWVEERGTKIVEVWKGVKS